MLNIHGKAKSDRYWTTNSTGEKVEVEDISDDLGFYTTRLLRFNDMFDGGKEVRTKNYYTERVINPASKSHGHDITGVNRPKFGMERTSSIGASFHHSTGHVKDL